MSGEDPVDRLRAQWARELPDLDTTPMGVFGRAHRLSAFIAAEVTGIFEAFGLDRGEFDVLATLRRSGAPYRLTPTEIYRSLMISSGGLTHRLGRLEAAGLIVRDPSAEDGRSLAVRLTEEGRQRVEAAFRADMTQVLRRLDPLTYAEKKTLADLLRDPTPITSASHPRCMRAVAPCRADARNAAAPRNVITISERAPPVTSAMAG